MVVKKRFVKTIIALSVAGATALAVLPAMPASAIGSKSVTCMQDRSVNGASQSNRATTSTPGVNYCGYARTRALYQQYPGGPSAYTSWTQSTTVAISSPGNPVLGGQHSVTNPVPVYGGFPFGT
jgi:hypothetical protein